MRTNSHQALRLEFLQRIQSGEWALGSRIPGEIQLAEHYGCARATVNRALRSLADDGLLIRKRKGGTHVSPVPARRARLTIPIVREEVEAMGQVYRHAVRRRSTRVPAARVRATLGTDAGVVCVYLETLHFANDRPFAFETRWINPIAVPAIREERFAELSANEWLVRSVPFSNGRLRLSAEKATKTIATALEISAGTAVFQVDRTTWDKDVVVTTMQLYYPPGYQLTSQL